MSALAGDREDGRLLPDDLDRIEADGRREVHEFDHVDSALAALDPRNVRLPATEPGAELDLSQTGVLPGFHEHLA